MVHRLVRGCGCEIDAVYSRDRRVHRLVDAHTSR
jgi:hypothetical protein